jgi:hypothetical protein
MFVATGFNQQDIVKDGLVLWLDANDKTSYSGTGTAWTNLTGNSNNNAVLVNGPTFTGNNGGAVVFDGTNDYAYIPATNNLSFNSSSFTYSLTFSIPNWTFSTERIVMEYGSAGYNGYYQLTFYPNATTFRTLGINGYNTWFDSTVNFANDQNYNVVLTYNLAASLASLYVNSVLINSATRTGTSGATPQILYIYSRGGGTIFQKGNLYSILAYNKALSAQEVLQNYNTNKNRFGL